MVRQVPLTTVSIPLNTQKIMKLLGERIRERRLSLGLSIEDLAKRSASSLDLIKELEWSMLKDIDLTTLGAIANAMEQSISDLVTDHNAEKSVAETVSRQN